MKNPILFTLDKGQTYSLNTAGHSSLQISLKEGAQDYVLVISGNDFTKEVSIDNITEVIRFGADSELSFLLKEGSTELSYEFQLELK